MRNLIDECIDERFRNSLPGRDCQTARYAGDELIRETISAAFLPANYFCLVSAP